MYIVNDNVQMMITVWYWKWWSFNKAPNIPFMLEDTETPKTNCKTTCTFKITVYISEIVAETKRAQEHPDMDECLGLDS